jgi:hypothetical protein
MLAQFSRKADVSDVSSSLLDDEYRLLFQVTTRIANVNHKLSADALAG